MQLLYKNNTEIWMKQLLKLDYYFSCSISLFKEKSNINEIKNNNTHSCSDSNNVYSFYINSLHLLLRQLLIMFSIHDSKYEELTFDK